MRRTDEPKELDRLSNSDSIEILKEVAKNTNTPPETLTKLANHEHSPIVANVAGNINTPPEVLTKLEQHSRYYVRRWDISNPNNPRNK